VSSKKDLYFLTYKNFLILLFCGKTYGGNCRKLLIKILSTRIVTGSPYGYIKRSYYDKPALITLQAIYYQLKGEQRLFQLKGEGSRSLPTYLHP